MCFFVLPEPELRQEQESQQPTICTAPFGLLSNECMLFGRSKTSMEALRAAIAMVTGELLRLLREGCSRRRMQLPVHRFEPNKSAYTNHSTHIHHQTSAGARVVALGSRPPPSIKEGAKDHIVVALVVLSCCCVLLSR